jgi:hypothetical protein
MNRFRLSYFGLAIGLLGLSGSSLATDLTSDNTANVVAWMYGGPSTHSDWAAALAGGPNEESIPTDSLCSNPSGCTLTFPDFTIAGANGVSGTILTSTDYPLTISVIPDVTGLELQLSGLLSVTLTLSDGSSVTTDPVSYASNVVTFLSPLPIVTATINSQTSGSIAELSWGSVNPADLPTQPVNGDPPSPSDTPEVATFLLMGGGLLLMSRWAKRSSWSF